MTREYRITADSFRTEDTSEDCVLGPDDPIHDLKPTAMMGDIGSAAALAKYNSLSQHTVVGSTRGQEAREQNIQPGTEAWFRHWFGGAR